MMMMMMTMESLKKWDSGLMPELFGSRLEFSNFFLRYRCISEFQCIFSVKCANYCYRMLYYDFRPTQNCDEHRRNQQSRLHYLFTEVVSIFNFFNQLINCSVVNFFPVIINLWRSQDSGLCMVQACATRAMTLVAMVNQVMLIWYINFFNGLLILVDLLLF